MTTIVKISNKANSNGDVHVRVTGHWSVEGKTDVAPGSSVEVGITDSSVVHLFESMPHSGPEDAERTAMACGEAADALIAKEVAGQDKMWGYANQRADSQSGELLKAGVAQAVALIDRREGDEDAFTDGDPEFYPAGWSGFRDYGSDVANLVVAAAFIRQEIKRLIAAGADTTRTSRKPEQPYTADQPAQPFPTGK